MFQFRKKVLRLSRYSFLILILKLSWQSLHALRHKLGLDLLLPYLLLPFLAVGALVTHLELLFLAAAILKPLCGVLTDTLLPLNPIIFESDRARSVGWQRSFHSLLHGF